MASLNAADQASEHQKEDDLSEITARLGSKDSVVSEQEKRLRFKVKLPQLNRSSSDQSRPRKTNYCPVCDKEFSSGKALGGHIRIHSMEQRKLIQRGRKMKTTMTMKNPKSATAMSLEKIECCLCHKEFMSMHSLFGHMRRHPNRGWKGVKPPEDFAISSEDEKGEIKVSKNSSCSSILENIRFEEGEDELRSFDEEMEEDTIEAMEAAYILMMLSSSGIKSEADKHVGNGNVCENDVKGKQKVVSFDTSYISPMSSCINKNKGNEVSEMNSGEDHSSRGAVRVLDFDLNQPYLDPEGENAGLRFDLV